MDTVDTTIEKQKKSVYDPKLYTDEAKQSRFHRVAERRMNKSLEALRLLGNVSNKSLYKYKDGEVEKMFTTLENALREVKVKFKLEKSEGNFRF